MMIEKSTPRILLVDDVLSNIDLLASILGDEYELVVATNGLDALDTAQRHQPELILLDISMPGMDGYETCRRLQSNTKTREIPIIFVTIRDSEIDERKGLEMGAVDYITRPFRPAILKVRVRMHLENRRQRHALEKMVRTDPLTSAYNRIYFEEFLDREWRRSRREDSWLTLIVLDVDRFRAYNDHCGRVAGDDCLKRVAMAVGAHLRRPTDLLARYADDEFIAILPQLNFEQAGIMADKLSTCVNYLNIPFPNSEANGHVTISIGFASIIPSLKNKVRTIIKSAHRMLDEARGKGCDQTMGIQL